MRRSLRLPGELAAQALAAIGMGVFTAFAGAAIIVFLLVFWSLQIIAGLTLIASMAVTMAVICGIMPPVNLLFWGYTIIGCMLLIPLWLLREGAKARGTHRGTGIGLYER